MMKDTIHTNSQFKGLYTKSIRPATDITCNKCSEYSWDAMSLSIEGSLNDDEVHKITFQPHLMLLCTPFTRKDKMAEGDKAIRLRMLLLRVNYVRLKTKNDSTTKSSLLFVICTT
jgi:hypothetical protein